MSLFNTIKKMFRVNGDDYDEAYDDEEYEYDEEDEEDTDDYEDDEPEDNRSTGSRGSFFHHSFNGRKTDNSRVINFNNSAPNITIVTPIEFSDVRNIAKLYLSRKTLILNFERTPTEVAGRILSFLTGVAFANGGQFKQIKQNNIYVLTPKGVDIDGENIGDPFNDENQFFGGSGLF